MKIDTHSNSIDGYFDIFDNMRNVLVTNIGSSPESAWPFLISNPLNIQNFYRGALQVDQKSVINDYTFHFRR